MLLFAALDTLFVYSAIVAGSRADRGPRKKGKPSDYISSDLNSSEERK